MCTAGLRNGSTLLPADLSLQVCTPQQQAPENRPHQARSRRGERRPRAWHGVPGAWRGRRAAEETAGGRARQVSGTDLELHQENSTWKPRLVDSRFFRQEAEVRERLRILGTPVFLLEDTEFFEKTVQYGKGTERTGRSRYCDLVTVLQTTSVLRKTGTENF